MTGTERDKLKALLTERGIEGVNRIVDDLRDDQIAGALGAVVWWDDMPHEGGRAVSSGLLVKKIRDGGLPGYRRPHERTTPDGTLAVTPERLNSMRRVLMSPEAVFDREQAREFFAEVGTKLNTPVDALVDSAMGADWVVTPPHPCHPRGWDHPDWTPKDQWIATVRYMHFVNSEPGPSVDTQLPREPGESDWDYACRWWGWTDTPEIIEAIKEKEATLRKERAAKKAAAKPKPKSKPEPVAAAASEDEPW